VQSRKSPGANEEEVHMEAPLGAFARALVIANPGTRGDGQGVLKAALARHAGSIEWRIRRIRENEDVAQVTREELGEGWDVVVAAGGDGTVSGVAQAAGEAGVPMLIAPMGTANMLAAELELPADLDGALALLERPTTERHIDGMKIDGSLHLLSAGVGVSAKTIHDLSDASKHRFGLPAYLWTGVASTFTFRPVRCTISIDGRRRRLRILDVSVLNAGFRSGPPMPGFPDIRPDDGKLDVLVVWTPSPVEYLRHLRDALLFWRRVDPNIMWTTAEHSVEIDCRKPLPVQADGDLIKETPVTIRLARGAVGVVVPRSSSTDVG
jgi:diacylglycerol kinase family enzyme